MPRRKSEKSQQPLIHPPPAKSICFRKGPHPITRQEEISSDSEEHDPPSEAVEGNSSRRASLLSNASLSVEQRNSSFQRSRTVCEDSDAKPNRSLEALFQAADSELQNYETSATRAVVSPRLIVDSRSRVVVELPESVNLIANSQGRPRFTASPDPMDIKSLPVPLLRVNFPTELRPRTLERQTRTDLGSSQDVIRVDSASSSGNQMNTRLVPSVSTELQSVDLNSDRTGQHKPKSSLKMGKCGAMFKPGKYVCMYCSRSCAKPSVLQKHLRTHTGERPYPCNDCGFRFKTKSNLYKHCKSRVHLTKMEPGQDVGGMLPTSEDCSGKSLVLELEMARDSAGKAMVNSEPMKEEVLQILPQQTTQSKPNLGLKFPSCDAQIGRAGSVELDSQQTLAARSLSVPESNEDRLSVALHSLLRLSDGSIYLMEKLGNGHAILRPVLQEVGLGAPNQTLGFGAPNQLALGLGAPNPALGHNTPNQALGLASPNLTLGLGTPNQTLGISTPNQGLGTPNQSVGLVIPSLSVPVNSSNLPDVVSGPLATKTNGWVVSANSATVPFDSVTGTKQTGSEEIHSSLSLPSDRRSPALHLSMSSYSKILQKSSSASVAMPAMTTMLTSHRSHSLSSTHTVSIAPKMAPIDPKNATPEAVQERIAMLISHNASIIDMPMADAPRPKRVLRHNSEVVSATNAESNAANLSKPLQRAKSLVPYTNISPSVTRINADLTTSGSSTMSLATKKRKAESLNSIDTASKTSSNFLLVPSDPNLIGCGLPMKPSIRPQTSNLEMLSPSLFPKPALPIKAKSLDMTAKMGTFIGSVYPQKQLLASSASGLPGGKRPNETAVQKMRILSETVDNSSAMHVPTGPQDIHVVFHLPSSIAPDMLNTSRELDTVAINSSACDVKTAAKAVSEKRQEFARAHLMSDNNSRAKSATQTTNSAEKLVDNPPKLGSTVPLQYLVIPAAPNPTQTFVPVVQSTLPTLAPQVAKSFDSTSQTSSVSVEVSESSLALKRGRPKGARNKQKALSSPPNSAKDAGSTFRSIPSICVTPAAESGPAAEPPGSLWKLKLKGRLLMKRSLSIERTLSDERESMPNRSLDTDMGSSAAADTRLPSDSHVYQETTGLQRSCSYDAAMPLKKRRKTLTELGRGTAFGTRVEDGAEAAQSRASPLLVETNKRSLSPVGNRRVCTTATISDVLIEKISVSCGKEETGIIAQGPLTTNCLSMRKDIPTNECSEQRCISSSICSVRGGQKHPALLRIPLTVAQKVPGLLPDRTDVSLVHPADNGTVNQHLEVLEKLDTYTNSESLKHKSVTAKHKIYPASAAAHGFTSTGHGVVENSMTFSGCINDIHSELRSSDHRDGSVVVQTDGTSTLLLLSHLYPSLNPSTNTTFCSVMKPQPMYLPQDANKKLSMYLNWQVAPAVSSCPATPEVSISSTLADRHMSITVSPHLYATSNMSGAGVLTHSSYWNFKKVLEKKSKSQEGTDQVDVTYDLPAEVVVQKSSAEEVAEIPSQKSVPLERTSPPDTAGKTDPSKISKSTDVPTKPTNVLVTKELKRIQIFPGGYKSNEDYVYIRGRGKGKYVCEACGIRCKKPSMLKKHLRTHTDIRPHHCDVCSFGFKTKGNLSKHIKSKAHHSRCSDLGIAPIQRFSATSDDASFDSQVLISSGGENNEASSSGDLHDDDDLDDVDNDCSKEDNDEDDDDDDDDDDDGVSLDGDGDDSLMSSDVPDGLMVPGRNGMPESTRSGYSFEGCSFGVQADIIRAATDSEAAASLLDLSKGDPTSTTMSTVPGINEISTGSHPPTMSQSPALFSRAFVQPSSSMMHSQTQDQEKNGSREKNSSRGLQNEVIPLKMSGFIPPVLLITSCPSSSFQLPSPVFLAISSTSMSSSISNSEGSHPWVVLNPSVLVQNNFDAGKPSPIDELHNQDDPVISGAPTCSVLTTPSILPPVCSPVTPPFSSGAFTSAAGSKARVVACEIVPVPGKVSGNVAECVDGKYLKYVCPVCMKSFSKAHQLALHKNIHYMERPFRCSDCDVSFLNRTLLDKHQRSEKHTCKTDDPRPFKCDDCGVAFRIHGHLAKHLRSKVHIVKCEGNGKVPSEDRDSEDMESESTPPPPPPPTDVISGMENVATLETGSNNSAVEMDLFTESTHESHRAVHTQEPTVLMTAKNVKPSTVVVPIEANVLAALRKNKSFSDAERTNNEGPSSQLEPHRCDICSKVFQDVALFEKHISSHVELRPYICEFCDAGFTNARLLESHLNTHYQHKEHVCGVCGDMLTGKMSSHQQSEVHASPSSHCLQPVSESIMTSSAVAETQNHPASSNDVGTCPVRILPEISAGNQFRAGDRKCCTGAIQPPESSGTGALLKVIPSPNILTLANPNVLLMKSFNVGSLPESGANNIALGLGSLNFPSGSSLIRSSAEILKSSTVSQPLSILLATPPGSFEDSGGVLSTSGFVPFHDNRQVSIRPDSGGEPVCRFLTVSFKIGENVFSESSVRTDHEKSAFIASNFSEIVQNSAAVNTTSASNLV